MAKFPILNMALLLILAQAGSCTAHAAERLDPTQPRWAPASTVASKPAPVSELTAIVIGDNKRLAIIGEQHLKIGDRYGDARVTSIAFDHIVLTSAAGKRTLRLTPELDSRTSVKATRP